MPVRRFLAACCDGAGAVVLGLLLSSTLGAWAATRAALVFRIGEPDSFWRGPIPWVLGALGNLTYALPLVLFLVLLPEAFLGSGPGKLLTGLHIVPTAAAGRRALLVRFLSKCAPCLAWLWALSLGQPWTLSVCVVSLVLWALRDRLAHTQVRASR